MSNKLVCCFSASGVTEKKARALAKAAGAGYYSINPVPPYTPEDLKWTNPLARCNREWLKKSAPPLSDLDAPVKDADEILLCFPIWYYTAPLIVKRFMESYDFSGKTVLLFATSGGSDMKRVIKTLAPAAPGASLKLGCMLNGEDAPDRWRALAEQG